MAAIYQLFPRGQFLHASLITLGSLALRPGPLVFAFDPSMKLGRVNVGMVERKARPDADSPTFGSVYEDTVGRRPYRFNQRWVETPEAYIWAPYLQPVKNVPNWPLRIAMPCLESEKRIVCGSGEDHTQLEEEKSFLSLFLFTLPN